MTMEVRPTGQPCGAEVMGIDLSRPLVDDEVVALRHAWLEHHVLVFADQHLTRRALGFETRRMPSIKDSPSGP